MGRQVIIRINSIITHISGEQETLNSEFIGSLYNKDGDLFLSYKEKKEEMGNTSTFVKWNIGGCPKVSIIRQGDVRMNQVFIKGYNHQSLYQSPNGALEMEIVTKGVTVPSKFDSMGQLSLLYELKLNKGIIGFYNLQLNYTEVEAQNNLKKKDKRHQ